MDWPPSFPNHLKARASAAVLKAQRQFHADNQAEERIQAGFFAFAEIACEGAEEGAWRGDQALHGFDEFLHTLCVYDPASAGLNENVFSRFAHSITQEITGSREYLVLVERLAAVNGSRPGQPVVVLAEANGEVAAGGAASASPPHVCDAGTSPSRSLRAIRGDLCAKVIGEVKQLDRELRSKSQSANFEDLRRDYPDFDVLKILSRSLFDDEDRELICHPRQWGVRPQRHATGILKRHFGTDSDETIRDYRKAYRRERSSGTS